MLVQRRVLHVGFRAAALLNSAEQRLHGVAMFYLEVPRRCLLCLSPSTRGE